MIYESHPKDLDAEHRANCMVIAGALWRYAQEHDGYYPQNMDILFDEKYLAFYPVNVMSGDSGSHEEMKNIPFGAESFEGNFTYIPVSEGDEIIGYYLIGYGSKDKTGMDVNGDGIDDHVIIVIPSTDTEDDYNDNAGETPEAELGDSKYILPPLADLLQPHAQDAQATE
jgi:hypothetical protein